MLLCVRLLVPARRKVSNTSGTIEKVRLRGVWLGTPIQKRSQTSPWTLERLQPARTWELQSYSSGILNSVLNCTNSKHLSFRSGTAQVNILQQSHETVRRELQVCVWASKLQEARREIISGYCCGSLIKDSPRHHTRWLLHALYSEFALPSVQILEYFPFIKKKRTENMFLCFVCLF